MRTRHMLAVTSSNACTVPSGMWMLDVRSGRSFLLDSCTHERPVPHTPLPHIPDIVACMCCCILQRVDVPDGLRRGAGSGECDSSLLLYSIDDSGHITQTPRRNTAPHSGRLHLGFLPSLAGSRDEMKMSLIWLLGVARYRLFAG